MISRIKRELLDSDIDMGISEVSETDQDRLCVAMKSGGARVFLSLFFLVPGILFFTGAVSMGSIVGWVLALVFCPVLFGLFALFAFGKSEKCFNREARAVLKSFRLLGFSMSSSEPIPIDGKIFLECKLSAGGKQSPGGAMRYLINIPTCSGSGISVYHDYQIARDFAGKLASFLSYEIEDSVAPEYRKNMKYPSYR